MALKDLLNKIKDIYTTVDEALGGYLPGATTPSEVKASNTPSVTTLPQSTLLTPTEAAEPKTTKTSSSNIVKNTSSPTGYSDTLGQPVSAAPAALETQVQTPLAPVTQAPVTQPVTEPLTTTVPTSDLIEEPLTFGQKVAKVALTPSAVMGNLITSGLEKITGKTYDRTKAEELARTPEGQALGLAIAGTATALVAAEAYFLAVGTAATTAPATLAASSVSATGTTTGVVAAGEVAANTATVTTGITATTGILSSTGAKLLSIGAIISIGWQLSSQQATLRKDLSTYLKDSGDLALKLRQAGMFEEADELYQKSVDLKNGLDKIAPFIPIFGRMINGSAIQKARDELNEINTKYNEQVYNDNKKLEEEAKAAEKAEEEAKEQEAKAKEEEKEAKAEAKEAEAEAKDQDPNNYYGHNYLGTGLTGSDYDRKVSEGSQEALAVESTGGSTLSFGILKSGGDIEYVDRDKASQYYFSKPYEELTPAQKKLLMMAKGEQQ